MRPRRCAVSTQRFIGICLLVQALGACRGSPNEKTAAPSPIIAAKAADEPTRHEEPNASFDPMASPPSAPREPEIVRTPVMTPKSQRHSQRRPGTITAGFGDELFCVEMYTVCAAGQQHCTSRSFTLGCGATGEMPTGDWVKCVCKPRK